MVEPLPLRHVDERLPVAARERLPVAQAQIDGGNHVLDHGLDGERQEARRSPGHPAAAGLVPREARAVEEQDVRA